MNIILNIIIFLICIIWFKARFEFSNSKLILPVIVVYIIGSILILTVSFTTSTGFDGLDDIAISGLSMLIFWLITTSLIIGKNIKKGRRKYLIRDLGQNSILLIIPIVLFVLLWNGPMKIGG